MLMSGQVVDESFLNFSSIALRIYADTLRLSPVLIVASAILFFISLSNSTDKTIEVVFITGVIL